MIFDLVSGTRFISLEIMFYLHSANSISFQISFVWKNRILRSKKIYKWKSILFFSGWKTDYLNMKIQWNISLYTVYKICHIHMKSIKCSSSKSPYVHERRMIMTKIRIYTYTYINLLSHIFISQRINMNVYETDSISNSISNYKWK